jgi:hypothetical protein
MPTPQKEQKNDNDDNNLSLEEKQYIEQHYFEVPASTRRKLWEAFQKRSPLLKESADAEPVEVDNLSLTFFEDFDLYKHLDHTCGRALQLGSSTGKFLLRFKQVGWDTTVGYDFAKTAITKMQKQGITAREADLNETDASGELTCREQLIKDLVDPINKMRSTHVFCIRLMEYLSLKAQRCLLYLLMDHAAPGSIFVIAGQVISKELLAPALENRLTPETRMMCHPSFKTSFFAARTDMQIKFANDAYACDHVLVVEKRSMKSNLGR